MNDDAPDMSGFPLDLESKFQNENYPRYGSLHSTPHKLGDNCRVCRTDNQPSKNILFQLLTVNRQNQQERVYNYIP